MVIGTAKNHRRRLSLKSIQFFSGYLKKKLVIVEKNKCVKNNDQTKNWNFWHKNVWVYSRIECCVFKFFKNVCFRQGQKKTQIQIVKF